MLFEKDQNVLSQVVDSLMQVCEQRVTRGTMESHVRYWLYNRSSTDLKNYICSALPLPTYQDIHRQMIQFHHRKYTAFNQEINRLKSSPHQFMPNSCNWVPAALLKEETTNHIALCYGGVLIAPEIEQGYVPHVKGNVRSVKIRGERSYRGYSVLYGSHSRQAPAGRAQASSRPYHQEAYRAPVNLAAPANPASSGQPNGQSTSTTTNTSTGDGSSSGGGSGGTGGSTYSGSSYPQASAAAGGEPPSSGDDSDESDYDSDSDGSGSTSSRPSSYLNCISSALISGMRHYHTMVQNKNSGTVPRCTYDPPAILSAVLFLNGFLHKHKANPQAKVSDVKLPADKLPSFSTYFCKDTKVKNAKGDKMFDIEVHEIVTEKIRNVVYLIRCKQTGRMYVGKAVELGKRMRKHLRQIKNPSKIKGNPSGVVSHFTSEGASIDDFEVIVIQHFPDGVTDRELRHAETVWMMRLDTKTNGMNKMISSKSGEAEFLREQNSNLS